MNLSGYYRDQIEPFPSTYEHVSSILYQYQDKVKQEASARMRAGIKSSEGGTSIEILGRIAGVSKNTIVAVQKLRQAKLPNIIQYHLLAGGMTINNGINYLKLDPKLQKRVVKLLEENFPNDSDQTYDRPAVHRFINKLISKLNEN